MSLDLTKIAQQVEKMVAHFNGSGRQRQQRLKKALDILTNEATNLDKLRKKIASSKTSWLVAEPVDEPDRHYASPPAPEDFTIIATDGSNIDVDRHQLIKCYLINIGSVILNYGTNSGAVLDSSPHLYSDDEDLVITSPEANRRGQPIEGALLGIKRGVEECRHLARIAVELPANGQVLALLDGSLILWGLVSKDYPEFVTQALLDNGFLRYLDQMRKLNNSQKKLATASYISFPRSTDVVNALRVAICPYQAPNCDRYCDKISWGKRECDNISGVTDRELFSALLDEKERSALFISQSSIVKKRYGAHRVYFFYLKVDDEIARIEIPEWVALNESRLELTHVLILDQCRRGHGYPVALAEAHEQAVITGADRGNLQQLMETLMAEECLPTTTSAKSRSKRTRWI
ncbi:MAG: DNA double-strand break repair nuclease NurA [Dehalococcoidales bacterium]|nr:DNA double-strand break repair nuclease NurA [Dehalococcoidales bacterium]